MGENIDIGFPFPLGAQPVRQIKSGIRVAFPSEDEDCGVLIYEQNSDRLLKRQAFRPQDRLGNIRYGVIENVDIDKISYLFYSGDKVFPDQWAHAYESRGKFGIARSPLDYRARINEESYDWGSDCCPRIPYEEMICYGMHVRGFTMHSSSGVKNRGTFAGIMEKLDYLQELGITSIELQPVYERIELENAEAQRECIKEYRQPREPKLNYWGYQRGYYYAPKSTYASSHDAAGELKDLIRVLHSRGMELILQFYFQDDVPTEEVLNVLRYWSWAYHVDGFHLMGGNLDAGRIAADPALSDRKLWYYDFPTDQLYDYEKVPAYRNLAIYNDGYQQDMRRFLKGDEGMLQSVLQRMRRNPRKEGVINYLTDYAGFTMMDMVSYDRKHNEDNGEDNRDGNDHNYSWNCGVEGTTRKRQILGLRRKQLRNAFTLLMLSQGTPYFYMGDEFGRSQRGNNNPYCHDNAVTWVNWKDLEKHNDIFLYVKNLIRLRQSHGIFHLAQECRLMDYRSCGCPDLSYHGAEAWKPGWEPYNRQIGILLNGAYGKDERNDFWYIAVNMHWEKHDFALPKLPKGKVWKKVFGTEDASMEILEASSEVLLENQAAETGPRSITIFTSDIESRKDSSQQQAASHKIE